MRSLLLGILMPKSEKLAARQAFRHYAVEDGTLIRRFYT